MGDVLTITLEDTRTGKREEASFDRFPVRVGRNPLNDLLLDAPIVSQWHGAFQIHEGEVYFTDLGSTNGTSVDGVPALQSTAMRLRPESLVEVGPLRLHTRRVQPERVTTAFGRRGWTQEEPVDLEPEDSDVATAMLATGSPDYQAALSPNGHAANGSAYAAADGHVPSTRTHPTRKGGDLLDQFRQTQALVESVTPLRRAYVAALIEQLEALPHESRHATIPRLLLASFPDVRTDPEVLAALARMHIDPDTVRLPSPADWHAELVGRDPGAPHENGHDARVMARSAAALRAFAQVFVELRRAHFLLLDELGVPRPPRESELDDAQTPEELLRFVLDIHSDGDERLWRLTRAFAELATHQVAMLQGLREGVRALLGELSPERARERARGMTWWPGATLRALAMRHRDLLDADHFSGVLFGPAFQRAYQLATGATAKPPPKKDPSQKIIVDLNAAGPVTR
ncbi:MAG: FHA domain-containing protein [Myxococcales bacterium]|nr:FHA domain-containing protein [Myxococcales bacterium]